MYTTTPANWPKAAAQRLQERHSEPRPPTITCTERPREPVSVPALAAGITLTAKWGSPGEAALRLGPFGVVGDAGAAARASSGRTSAQRGALNLPQLERRAEAILAALEFAQRPMSNSEITAAAAGERLTHGTMAYALTRMLQDGRIVAARHGAAGSNWYSLPAWGKDRRLPERGVPVQVSEREEALASKRLRRALEVNGPMTNGALALAVGVPPRRVGARLQPLLRGGIIVRSGARGRYIYSLADPTKAA